MKYIKAYKVWLSGSRKRASMRPLFKSPIY